MNRYSVTSHDYDTGAETTIAIAHTPLAAYRSAQYHANIDLPPSTEYAPRLVISDHETSMRLDTTEWIAVYDLTILARTLARHSDAATDELIRCLTAMRGLLGLNDPETPS